MPVTHPSVLDIKAKTDLRPGETGLRLKDDPYYGKVDLGPEPDTKDAKDGKNTADFEKKERAKISQLPADERPAAEEKLAKELAKKRIAAGKTTFDPDDPLSIAPAGTTPEKLAQLDMVEERIEEGVHILSGDEQSHVEVLTGKRLQQKATTKDAKGKDAGPREPEEVTEPDGPLPKTDSTYEPPERDRDKTKAAKPGESAKS